jgi:hypothetical protein
MTRATPHFLLRMGKRCCILENQPVSLTGAAGCRLMLAGICAVEDPRYAVGVLGCCRLTRLYFFSILLTLCCHARR